MNSAELLLILFVALIVFGPSKLPMLASHLGKLMRHFNLLKQQAYDFWQSHMNEEQLKENQRKAELADKVYLSDKAANDEDEKSGLN